MKKRSRSQRKSKKRKSKRKMDGSVKDSFVVVSLKGCPYCKSAINLINKKGIKMINLDLDMSDSKQKKFWNSFVKSQYNENHTTFPKIFREGNFIGGYSELQQII